VKKKYSETVYDRKKKGGPKGHPGWCRVSDQLKQVHVKSTKMKK